MTKTHFIHYPVRPKKLTAAFAKKEYAKLLGRLPQANASDKPDLWIELFKDWNALKSYVSSEYGRISNAFDKDMADKQLEAAKTYLREKLSPVVDEPEFELTKAFLASRHREALAKHYGAQLIPIYESALKPLDPRNTTLSIKDGELTNTYSKLVAGAKVSMKGEAISLQKARSYLDSPNESERREAYFAIWDWFLAHQEKIAAIYNQLVSLRTSMAKNVGYSTYTPLAYEAMGRTDYGREEVEKFRNNVKRYFTPLLQKLYSQQAKDLGRTVLKPWDAGYMYTGCNPRYMLAEEKVPITSQLDKAQTIFTKLHPRFGKHFAHMREQNLIDLENRPNKRAGAYCTSFSDEEKVLILCNSTGNSEDIETLTHEMGHAFQFWESIHIESIDLQCGSYDLAEVHSTSMEFLCLPYIDEFFSTDDAAKYTKSRWIRSLATLCYVCIVDEFQHWVYEHPEASPTGRDNEWVRLTKVYLPQIDFDGMDTYQKTRWYAQQHIFNSPFYYIDYALAIVGAMQIATLASNDHESAMKKYLELCRIGGTFSFLQAFKHAGLASPFNQSTFETLAAHTKKTLEL